MTFRAIDGGLYLPVQPDWSLQFTSPNECATAAQYWSRIIATMRVADTITAANGHAIERLVVFQIICDCASAAVARDGAIRRIKGVDRKNPNFMVLRHASEACSGLEAELGLSPAKRNRAGKVARRGRSPSAADEFVRPFR
jgi:phage terminase small subunit